MGWECANPNLEELPYDFVVRGIDESGFFKTVQVKQSYPYGKGKERCDIRKRGPRNSKICYQEGDFDFLAAFKPSKKTWYIIPYEDINNVKSEIDLSSKKWQGYRRGS